MPFSPSMCVSGDRQRRGWGSEFDFAGTCTDVDSGIGVEVGVGIIRVWRCCVCRSWCWCCLRLVSHFLFDRVPVASFFLRYLTYVSFASGSDFPSLEKSRIWGSSINSSTSIVLHSPLETCVTSEKLTILGLNSCVGLPLAQLTVPHFLEHHNIINEHGSDRSTRGKQLFFLLWQDLLPCMSSTDRIAAMDGHWIDPLRLPRSVFYLLCTCPHGYGLHSTDKTSSCPRSASPSRHHPRIYLWCFSLLCKFVPARRSK